MKDRFLTRYYDTLTQQIIKLNTIINTCENGKDIEFYGICVSGAGQISQVDLDKNEYRFKRMQCTGLNDKNGKLIYEGDIVKFSSIYGHAFFEIKWNNEFATFGYEDEDTDFSELGRLYNEPVDVEILGNIYENPELLNKEQE